MMFYDIIVCRSFKSAHRLLYINEVKVLITVMWGRCQVLEMCREICYLAACLNFIITPSNLVITHLAQLFVTATYVCQTNDMLLWQND